MSLNRIISPTQQKFRGYIAFGRIEIQLYDARIWLLSRQFMIYLPDEDDACEKHRRKF